MQLPYVEDPLPLLARLRSLGHPVLLHGADRSHPASRHDVLAAGPEAVLTARSGRAFLDRGAGPEALAEAPLAALATLHGELPVPTRRDGPFGGGLLGLAGYDLGRGLLRAPPRLAPDHAFPELVAGVYPWALVTDHRLRRSELVVLPGRDCPAEVRALLRRADRLPPVRPAAPPALQPETSRAAHRRACERVLAYLHAGDCYQVNLAVRFAGHTRADALALYAALLARQPAPFGGFLETPDGAVLSFSPERFLRVADGRVETRPIKGTRARDADPLRDRAARAALLASPKDRAENLMIVDLLRNDLGRSCRPGSVRVPALFRPERFRAVHHLVSVVRGELAPGVGPVEAFAAAFPGGSVTGAPKVRAMDVIEELEDARRGPYCGSLLLADGAGRLDSSITIRTLLHTDGRLLCWGGGGIVADSDPDAEWEEIRHKVGSLVCGA
ncbi:MAG: aminodeoxychorismate synthase component I [Pseudomonadales bacterium]|jgi:para-aminobenzoate synthetase component 1|nr:aminodeoxychorismate synthase component I [Pseudomonadales bacterium]